MIRKISMIVASFVVGAWALASAQSAPSLQGAWRVTEVVVTGANASTNTSPQPSLYVFTRQHYSIMTVNGTTARKGAGAPKDPARLTDAEKLAQYDLWNPFTANSGTYQVSGSTLTTSPLVAKNPGVMGGTQTREFKIDGTTLTLIQKSPAGQPASETRTKLTRLE
jgi:Lipocalin-like domain